MIKRHRLFQHGVPATLLEDMREEYLALLERNQHLQSDIMMAPHQTNGGSMGVIGSEKWLEYATHPGIVSTASQLIGEDHPLGYYHFWKTGF